MENLTKHMHSLEIEIARQQKYISKHGEANDENPDEQWEQYKREANENLRAWDELKGIRDKLKIFQAEHPHCQAISTRLGNVNVYCPKTKDHFYNGDTWTGKAWDKWLEEAN